jgi:hypothetical protein
MESARRNAALALDCSARPSKGDTDPPHLQRDVERCPAFRSHGGYPTRPGCSICLVQWSRLRVFEGVTCEAFVKELPLERVGADVPQPAMHSNRQICDGLRFPALRTSVRSI